MRDFSWIINESNLPWLELDITFPFEEMHQEAINLKDYVIAFIRKNNQ